MLIEEAFGLAVRFKEIRDPATGLVKGKQLLPPPPNVLRVLGNLAARDELSIPGHGTKTAKRRSKRRRLRRRERFLQRQTWRAFHEQEKREKGAT